MSLLGVRTAIAEHYRSEIDDVFVSEHGGAFSLADIKKYAVKTPAVIIGCLGVPKFTIQGTVITANAIYAAFCMTHESNVDRRDASVLLLAESVAAETPLKNWGSTASGTPTNISGANLRSAALDNLGIAMWAVRWEQKVDLQRNAIATLDDFLTMNSTYDIGETDDTVDTTDILELAQ